MDVLNDIRFGDQATESFQERRFFVETGILPRPIFESVRDEVLGLPADDTVDRSYIPTHKKGGTIGYDRLRAIAPETVAFYQSAELAAVVSRLVGVPVVQTPLGDLNSLSVLRYERPGDHIGWHFDHNFYRGRHFTVLLALENRGTHVGGISHARLFARIAGTEVEAPTPLNTLVVFEGARVVHRATPIHEGERRILLSMTFCADPRASSTQWWARKLKDMAFYGFGALHRA